MLDFNSVQQRGIQRMLLIQQEQEAPPHVTVIDPLVQQLMGEDYCAGNGGLLTPHEAANMAGLLHNMGHTMDMLEHQRDEAQGAAAALMESVEVLAAKIGRYRRVMRWAGYAAIAAGLYVSLIVITVMLTA